MIRALIVDDEEPARARLGRLLAANGLEVVGEAADGQEALGRIAALAPDLVFLDIQMPGLSGLDVAGRLPPPRPRIVFCTAFDRFAVDAFEHHAVDYLLKPVNAGRLSLTLERVCGEIGDERQRAREQEDAVRTQARLMPTARPAIYGLDVAAVCRPARGVGGDYYDLLALGPDRVGLAVGDVSGTGTFAGLLAAALQARLPALTARGIDRPSCLLAELNRLTIGTMEDHRFATVFLATCDAADRTLRYASAGHTPALLVGLDGTLRELASTGPAIGWTRHAAFDEASIRVEPGDVLAVSTDGITEATAPDGEPFGTIGLTRVVRCAAGLGADALLAEILAEIDRFTAGAPADDDRTLLIARIA
jgi:CheY-like chemotaxis protein